MAHHKLFCYIPDELFLKLKEIKIEYKMDWSTLLIHLCDTNTRPETYQRGYKLHYTNGSEYTFNNAVKEIAWLKFATFAVPFKNQGHALDYLAWTELNGKIGKQMGALEDVMKFT